MATGANAPPMFPTMFMVPETVPAYWPPTSMAAVQAPGITRSFEKLATPMASIARSGSCNVVETSTNAEAPASLTALTTTRQQQGRRAVPAVAVDARHKRVDKVLVHFCWRGDRKSTRLNSSHLGN